MPNLPAESSQAISRRGSTGSGRVGPPRYPTRFVGRRAEIAALRGLLQPGRLVTVVGLGGAGKTRLAAEMAFGDHDCVWVDLSTATGPSDVAGGVAVALGLPAGGGADPTVGVVNALRDRADAAGARQLRGPASSPAGSSSTRCWSEVEALTVLATSRVPLSSAYEWLHPLPPLAEGERAVRRPRRPSGLRTSRPGRLRPSPNCAAWSVVLPLAIELLAAWSHVRSPTEQLRSRPEELSSRTATVLPRHRDMTAVLDASMALLTSDQQRVLASLGVFAGGFTAEAAEVGR